MAHFSEKNTMREVMRYPGMEENIHLFENRGFSEMITEAYMDTPLGELADRLTMPWGMPFAPGVILGAAERTIELMEGRYEFIPLWPDTDFAGVPYVYENDRRSVCLMKLKGGGRGEPGEKKPVAIICPGGGYEFVSMVNEGVDFAERFEAAGYAAYILVYRVAPNRYPEPQKDLALAIKYIRAHAGELNLDPDRVLITGASAAGHLCASETILRGGIEPQLMADLQRIAPDVAAQYEGISVRADRVVLVYPVIDFLAYPHEGSFQALAGGDESMREKLSLQRHVGEDFPKTFIWANRDDEAVPCMNSILMAQALEKKGVPVTLRLYERGGHGCGLARGLDAEGWFDAMLEEMA